MILIIAILFISTLTGGLISNSIDFEPKTIKYPLIFAGSFLFAITLIHILPEIFSFGQDPMRIGLYILLGFFLQQFLEYFSSGIEHGHFHKGHHLTTTTKWSMVLALTIHSLLEGAMLTHDSPFHGPHESHSLLTGIILHKVPAAFALMTTLKTNGKFTLSQWLILLLFSMASPIGLLLSSSILELSHDHMLILFAIVSGSFLHISTTIFVESSPDHHFGSRKILVSALGAGVAIASEYLI
ncbi:ZIP family metal transporter [Marinoscillum sp. MHG1-6]|uniref:ZIP family metal transporter n=1 Tax=Marinoscillum sp. MHG1-6 TaxID=2959627 RepID=UPI00215757F6|nr:ZIP family metal transporter [Marinoscillum sp. MHG1-6]